MPLSEKLDPNVRLRLLISSCRVSSCGASDVQPIVLNDQEEHTDQVTDNSTMHTAHF